MESIWMGIAPGPTTTRVIAMAGPSDTILKAQLAREPHHPRALATLFEAVALWQGQPVRAALCAGPPGLSCDSSFFREVFSGDGGETASADSVGSMTSSASSFKRWPDDLR